MDDSGLTNMPYFGTLKTLLSLLNTLKGYYTQKLNAVLLGPIWNLIEL